MDQLNQDFLAFIGLLEEENVDYLVVGGYAVGLHGFPRYTGDIDFFVAISECFARRIEAEIGGMTVKFIGKDDLILNKAASGRPKDRIDLEELRNS